MGDIKNEVRSIVLEKKHEKKKKEEERIKKLDVIAEEILKGIYPECDEWIKKIKKQAIDMARNGEEDPFRFKISELRTINFGQEQEGDYYSLLEKKGFDELFRVRFRVSKIVELLHEYFYEKEFVESEIIKKEGTHLSISFLRDRDVPDLTTYD